MQDYIACNKSDSVAVDAALTQYLSTADGSFSDLKSTFVTNLFSQFSSNNSSNWDPATALKALEALKVVCRQPEGCDAVYSESGIECIIKLAGLYTGMAYVETDFSVEALKILSNCILLKREDVTSMVVDGGVGETVFAALSTSKYPFTKFLLCRILFFISLRNQEYCEMIVEKYKANDIILNVVCFNVDFQTASRFTSIRKGRKRNKFDE